MSTDDQPDGSDELSDFEEGSAQDGTDVAVRERLEEAGRARAQFDDRIVDLMSWVLDTETRARIYVYLRQNAGSTSEEIAEGTGLYPSTVREALAALHEEGTVERGKRESKGAGNNPYEYTAIAPSDLVANVVEEVQAELNAVFNLDRHIGVDGGRGGSGGEARSPVTITVEDDKQEERSH